MLWIPGIRKTPILSNADIKSLAPIGLFAAAAHGGSVLAMGAGAVSFAQVPCDCVRAQRSVLQVCHKGLKPGLEN
jgi:hypothetical protein